jgi:hypothetical protein
MDWEIRGGNLVSRTEVEEDKRKILSKNIMFGNEMFNI